jgi:hypothetical protein
MFVKIYLAIAIAVTFAWWSAITYGGFLIFS